MNFFKLIAALENDQYVSQIPGGSEGNLKNDDKIDAIRNVPVLEDMIGMFLIGKASDGND